ncbi:hexitol phosphatase HxpB [Psychromonas sp.]|uniref:hexitol phosphatase HxpB n=1 Tax=Psychromonas sp. TaxID=1884585 RepID=UPI003563D5D8
MIKAIIFDMDGVIVDSEPFWRQAKVNAVARFGGNITLQQTYQSTGLRIDEIAQHWIRHCGLDPACQQALCDTILDEVIEQIKHNGKLLPGVLESLQWLATTELKVGLASSSPSRLIAAVLDIFDLNQYISIKVSAEHLLLGKPHPQVYLEAANQLGIAAQQCLAIEDSVNGLLAAKAARMVGVCVPEPGQENNPSFGIADYKFTSLEEFISPTISKLLRIKLPA